MKYNLFNNHKYEIHRLVLDYVASNSKVLDLGCATGYFAQALKQKGCTVVGVDGDAEALSVAKRVCDQVYKRNFEEKLTLPEKGKFDVILLMDVVEHLINRDKFLNSLHDYLAKNGVLILTTPNVANISIRAMLLTGSFNYSNTGLMDKTHVHFFTRKTLIELLVRSGFKIILVDGSADLGLIPVIGRFLLHIPKGIQYKITQLFPTLLVGQWLVIAAPIKK